LASWYPEKAFLQVQLDFVMVEVVEGFSRVVDQRGSIYGLDDDIVDINLNIPANLFPEAGLHTPLIGRTRVF
jgi:hypothetical protein